MITSRPPAPPGTWKRYLERSAIVARFVAALLVTTVSVRFSIAGVERALGVSSANFAARPSPHADGAIPHPSASPVTVAGPAASSAAPAASAPKGPPGRSVRTTLEITAGPPRSDVYVNGRVVGQTPFLGDLGCKTGLPLRIELVPPQGAPITYTRECHAGTLEISQLPP